jgi:short-subunit dehydrogenase
MGAYSTAKWGQRAIARTLQQELRDERDVHVCIVSPGSTNTPIYYQAANYLDHEARPPVPVLQPERVASEIVELSRRPRGHVSVPVGPPNPVIITGFRFLPFVYDRIVGPLFRVGALTRKEQGPTSGNVLSPQADEERVHGHWPER